MTGQQLIATILLVATVLGMFILMTYIRHRHEETQAVVLEPTKALMDKMDSLQAQLKAHDDRYPWFDQKGEPVVAPGGE